jgi:hypothetical protein
MPNPSSNPRDARADPAVSQQPFSPHAGFFLRELPYSAVLILTLVGVAYTSFSRNPIVAYWEFLAPVIGVACVFNGWRRAHDKETRARLIWTQALHWLAFLAAMNLLLLPAVQNMLNSNATGLATLLLLALGTFVAGVHILAWEICLLGVVMALCVPAIAWFEESALILLLGAIALLGIGGTIWWVANNRRAPIQ